MQIFGDPTEWPEADLIGFSEEYSAEVVLQGYAEGVFPMPLPHSGFEGRMGWWSPVWRGILPDAEMRITRSLRKSAKHYRCTVDADFEGVLRGCADPSRPDGWIDLGIKATYRRLHKEGFVHSVEVWDAENRLAGGLYGVALGGLFAGESMFHAPHGRDASKVALMHLCRVLRSGGAPLLDVQWRTDHLESLGVAEIPREEYLDVLPDALGVPGPDWDTWRASAGKEHPHAGDA